MNEANTEVVDYKSLSLALHTILLNKSVNCRTDLQQSHYSQVALCPYPLDSVAQVLDCSELVVAKTLRARLQNVRVTVETAVRAI